VSDEQVTILVADDDALSRELLRHFLEGPGRTIMEAGDGNEAWKILSGDPPPDVAVLDWMMPGMDGLEICRCTRELKRDIQPYLLLVTVRSQLADVVRGLDAGADDYVTKPWDPAELRARVNVALRVAALQKERLRRIRELEEALEHVRRLQGILPICMYCKKIRSDEQYWQEVEQYISEHSDAMFSHSVCPDCYKKYLEPQLEDLEKDSRTGSDASRAQSDS